MRKFRTWHRKVTSGTKIVNRPDALTKGSNEAISGTEVVRQPDPRANEPVKATLGSMPTEILLKIIEYLLLKSVTDATCLCLTNKRFWNELGPTCLPLLKARTSKSRKLLKALEGDLPWNYYLCCLCTKLHKHQYEQDDCPGGAYEWSLPGDHAFQILQNNVKVIKRKYLAPETPEGTMPSNVSISYRCKNASLSNWCHLEVRPDSKENLYLRSQMWLRWAADMWECADDRTHLTSHSPFVRQSYCPHNHSHALKQFTECTWKLLGKIFIQPMTPNPTLITDPFMDVRSNQDQHWKCVCDNSCNHCGVEIRIHLRFVPVPVGGVQRALHHESDLSHDHQPRQKPPTNRFSTLFKRRPELIETEEKPAESSPVKPSTLYWCDTMVTTEWRGIGPASSYSTDVRLPGYDDRGNLVVGPGYQSGASRTAFDGKADVPYHPVDSGFDHHPL